MKIFLIRHLETAFNQKGVLQGRRDIPILKPSSKTQEQISRNRALLEEGDGFDHILISRLKRTRMTAELYTERHCTVEPLLDELDFGYYEGRKKETLLATYKTITRPILEYTSTIWSPIAKPTNIQKLQTVDSSSTVGLAESQLAPMF